MGRGSVYKKVAVAVTAPGFNGGAERVIARFAYDTASLTAAGSNYGFTGVTPRVQNATIARLKAIYYPATKTGYWLGYSDSYYCQFYSYPWCPKGIVIPKS